MMNFFIQEELCVAILEAYVGDLIENDQVDLVAAYVAVLPANLQVEWYAKFLEGKNFHSSYLYALNHFKNWLIA